MKQIPTRILLKARPTERQLIDRFRKPVPEGLELYLDPLDLTADRWLDRILDSIERSKAPKGTTWIVEAPIRTIGGQYFDLTKGDEDHRETIRRVVDVGKAIGAVAANIHVVAPSHSSDQLTPASREAALRLAGQSIRFYIDACDRSGLIPQIENIPPVGRMREAAFVFSPIGAAPADLLALVDTFPSLRITLDVSHAALYLNWQQIDLTQIEPELRFVACYHRHAESMGNLAEYVAAVTAEVTTVHVSNASGLLGEGRDYTDGDEDLDNALRGLVGRVPYFVTETLEPNPDVAVGMRDAQTHLLNLRDAETSRSQT